MKPIITQVMHSMCGVTMDDHRKLWEYKYEMGPSFRPGVREVTLKVETEEKKKG